ncbi:MAG: arsenate reductase [Betaproteobacteria bacterium]|jgi:Spx/MgsR family transcriptional regulator|nr:arsenate reductase [Betaproteobacteria bacterium]NCA00329.1 arsenate reductase [Betaproteobacteria bacterium]NDB44617.1 arsenate reductase [Betaproteobacteria bacterium]NDD00980.1 arsenate reductase [Betaproteobacteria bacterium]NDD24166.1 arsenate reductase [Betaproteobacteria bacterium]
MKYTRITLYGIPNCDTVKKARTWLTDQGFEYVFHDFKKQGLPEKALNSWLKALDWETVVNRKGTSWRKLSPDEQASVTNAVTAKPFLLANPSLVKRPVIEWQSVKGTVITVGYQPEQWLAR